MGQNLVHLSQVFGANYAWGMREVQAGHAIRVVRGPFGEQTYLCRPPGYWAALQSVFLGATRRAALRAVSAKGIRQLVGGEASLDS